MSVGVTATGLTFPRRQDGVAAAGGSLTWLAAGVVSAASLSAAVAAGDGKLFWAAGGCTLIATVFALRADVGLVLLILARPSLDLWANEPIASTSGWLRLNVASLTALTLILVGGAFVVERWETVRRAAALKPFLLFAAISGVGVAVSPLGGQAVYEWFRLVSLLVIYAVSYAVIRLLADPRRLAVVILLSAALPIGVGAYQTAHGGTRLIADFGRATGTFLHPVPFGIFLALVISFGTPLFFSRTLPWHWAFRLAAPLAIVALIGTYTRTAWIGALLGLLLVAVRRHRSLLVLGPLVVAAVAFAVPSTVTRSTELSADATVPAEAGDSVASRLKQWELNLPEIQRNPVIGQGLWSIAGDEGSLVHSDYIRAAVETGVFGLVAYVWLLCAAAAGSYRSLKRAARAGDDVAFSIALGALAAGMGFLLMSVDSNLMTQVVVASTFWCIAAVGHAAAPKELRVPR